MLSKFGFNRRGYILAKNSRIRKNLKSFDKILWCIPIFLVIISGILIGSTQRQANYADWYQHWITGLVGIFLATQLAVIPLEKLRRFLIPLYGISIISLISVRIIGVSALGAQRWLDLGIINFQPSELAKIIVILALAEILNRYPIQSLYDLVKPLLIIFLPWVLVFIQPDLGTSLVFAAILLTMLYWASMPIEWIFLIISSIITAIISGIIPWALFIWIPLTGVLAFRSLPQRYLITSITIFWQILVANMTPWLWIHALKDYQRDRLVLFLDPTKDPLGGGYHLIQSTIGIGSGGWLGAGLLQGELTKLRFIPEQHTDFIFSALGEETGFIGTSIILFLYALLIIKLLKIAKQAHTDFESLVVIGITAMLFFQIIVNVFMTIGLGPVTGIPLPFMSYGRSALIVNFLAIGLCISVARRCHDLSKKW